MKNISFFELENAPADLKTNLHNTEVSISGFYYESGNQAILSSQPDLKTCCIGKKKKRDSQIFLDKHFSDIAKSKAIKIKGIFTFEEKPLKYSLKQTELITSSLQFEYFMLLFPFILYLVYKLSRNKRRNCS